MIAIIAKDVRIFSFPLGELHVKGYAALVSRVCQIKSEKMTWTGFAVVKDEVLTTGFYPHGKEFDVEFCNEKPTSGFLVNDWGDVIEVGVSTPYLDSLYAQYRPVAVGQKLFVIGSILGIPWSLAECEIEKILLTNQIVTSERLRLLDPHSVGSPVFNHNGALVGILEAYIEETDRMVIRCLTANGNGLLH